MPLRTLLRSKVLIVIVAASLAALLVLRGTAYDRRLSSARNDLDGWDLVKAVHKLQSLVDEYPAQLEPRRLYADCLLKRGELHEARTQFIVLVESDSVARMSHLLSLSFTHFLLGDLDTAAALAGDVLVHAREASVLRARAIGLLGRIAFNRAQYDSAMVLQRRSLKVARECGSPKDEADALRQIGVLCWYHGRSDSARISYYQPAREIYQKINDRIGEATALNNIALAGGPMRFYLDAFVMRKSIGDQIGLADSYYFVTGGDINHWSDLMYSFRRKSLEISRRIGYQWGEDVAARAVEDMIVAAYDSVRFDPLIVDTVMMESTEHRVQRMLRKSSELLRDGRTREAADLRGRVVSWCDSIGYTIGLEQALALHVITLIDLGEYDEAEAAAQRLCRVWTANPIVAGFQLAKVYVAAGRTADATRLLKSLVRQLDSTLLTRITGRDAALPLTSSELLTTRYQLYSMLMEALHHDRRKEEVFTFCERFRSLPFAWEIDTRITLQGKESIWHRYVHLLEEIERGSGNVDRLLIEFDEAHQHAVGVNSDAAKAARGLFGKTIPAMADIQRALHRGQVLVEYFVGKERGHLVALRRDTSILLELAQPSANVNSSARTLLELLRRGHTAPDDALWRGPARYLHSVLIQPLLDHGMLKEGDHLIVSPQGRLLEVPFACLLDSSGAALIQRFTLSSLPSSSHLQMHQQQRKLISLLAVVPERKSLPFAEREVNGIPRSLFSSTSFLFDEKASTAEFLHRAAGPDVVHVAAHGSIHHWHPLFSSLRMHDGPLELHRVLNLRLSSPVVVLSSCETGLGVGMMGDIARGHEAVGFPHAFLAAGASSVIAPLWIVEDEATSYLMLSMYSELASLQLAGESLTSASFARALTLAQRHCLTQSGNQARTHPFFWAGFYLTGNPN
jgi:CHAT domain-containing protein/tetratricopeptide (TPR) repeat protein